ncbi:MAG: ATP-binding protein [Rhodospirillaceae bacterium]
MADRSPRHVGINGNPPFIRLVAVVLFINLLVIAAAGVWLSKSWSLHEDRAMIATQNLATVLEKTLMAFIGKVDLTLLAVADEITREVAAGGIDREALDTCLRRHTGRLPEALGLRVAGSDGVIEFAVGEVINRRINIAASRHFIRVRDEREAGLVIGEPMLGRVSGRWVIVLARRLERPGGDFAGEVHVSVPVDYFTQMFSALAVGPHGAIALRDSDLGLIARYPAMEGGALAMGSRTASPGLRQLIATGQDRGTYFSPTTGPDNIARIVSYRRLAPYPLYIIVAAARQDYIAEWQREAAGVALLVAAFCLLTLMSTGLEYRSWRQRIAASEAMARQAADSAVAMARARDDAEAAHRRIEAILSSAGQGIFGVDREGRTTFVNQAASRMIGRTPEDILGRHQHELFHQSRADGSPYPEEACPISHTVRDGTRHHVADEVFWHRDGTAFPVDYVSTPIEEAGAIIGSVVAFHDISDHLARESALRLAREAADEANQAKSRFLATMSHEIRTPVTGVLGMVDLLRRTELTEEQAGYVRTLASSTQTLLTVLNDILDLSKIEAGKITLENTVFDLGEAAAAVVDLSRGMASAKGLTITFHTDAEVPAWVAGDPARLKQSLYNLINNAVKFTAAGSIHLRLTLESRRGGTAVIRAEVEDTGIGIDRDQIARLFQPFSQADSSTTRRYGGTGLGLMITKRLVELMGGEIGVASRPGLGSRFWITLPFEIATRPGRAAAAQSAVATPARPAAPLSLLIAEDNRINQMLLRAMLQKFGHTVEVVDNGREALAAVQARSFDAVLMDMQMPDMNGEDATRAIRALPSPCNRIPVLALTADVMAEHRERYLAAGIDALVAKPIDWDTLTAALATATTGRTDPPAPA